MRDSRISRQKIESLRESPCWNKETLVTVRASAGGVSEMRIHTGPGYRVYYRRKAVRFLLLCGGDKGSQRVDISRAQKLAREL